jgi:hypothetical protein
MLQYEKGNGTRRRAIKCDHCQDLAHPACLQACPAGALFEIAATSLFSQAEAMGPGLAPAGPLLTDAAFVRGPTALQQTPPRHAWIYHPLFTVVMLAALAGLGVEVFLRSAQAESSLSARLLPKLGIAGPIEFRSGRGLGHWLGYIGATSMLVSVLYSLRARVRRFERWGRMSAWLSAHQWLGFAGGTLVTYHSALKLDRWAGIACFLMWFVLATGILGRYIKGRTRSALNLIDFERRAQARRWGLGLERLALSAADAALRHWNIVHIVLAIAMFILAAIHIVYGFLYKAV